MNCYYKNSIRNFLNDDSKNIIKELAFHGSNDPFQMEAWEYEIEMLKEHLLEYSDDKNGIVFEYTIPRLSKRIDVVLIIEGIIFVVEYKVGSDKYVYQDMDQVMDYALDLQNFHKESENRLIVPILVSSEAKDDTIAKVLASQYDDKVLDVICVSGNRFGEAISEVCKKFSSNDNIDFERWIISRYEPTPTIIEAASALYMNHTVDDITKHEAEGKQIDDSTNCILDIIKHSKTNGRKSICFLTGVPGAGKTLVGLNVAIKQSNEHNEGNLKNDLAVYLSGNGPLVKVLTAALARDKKDRDENNGKKCNITDAKREVSRFIQEIYNYREQMLGKIELPIKNGILKIDESKTLSEKNAGFAEIEHIAIFDEAQRSWNLTKLSSWLSRGGSYGNKKKVPNFPMSEAEFLIWSLNLRKDWAVIICLVGGGQEIHDGEAGISEWIRAVNDTFKEWDVYVSPHLTDKEYAEGKVKELLDKRENVVYDSKLHLAVSMRSFRAEKLSTFVHYLLNIDINKAKESYETFKDKYPIVLTRDIEKAKDWLRNIAKGSERYGIIVSSRAERLRPLAIDVKHEIQVEHWFLDDKKDLRSSNFLEDVATEFDIQGLELDYACVTWDGDLRLNEGKWDFYNFRTNKWQKVKKEENQNYQINAYRVLLTRARKGMILCVPKGSDIDETRKPEYYDSTYKYLKSIGIKEI